MAVVIGHQPDVIEQTQERLLPGFLWDLEHLRTSVGFSDAKATERINPEGPIPHGSVPPLCDCDADERLHHHLRPLPERPDIGPGSQELGWELPPGSLAEWRRTLRAATPEEIETWGRWTA